MDESSLGYLDRSDANLFAGSGSVIFCTSSGYVSDLDMLIFFLLICFKNSCEKPFVNRMHYALCIFGRMIKKTSCYIFLGLVQIRCLSSKVVWRIRSKVDRINQLYRMI
jgi:hypothetical protein